MQTEAVREQTKLCSGANIASGSYRIKHFVWELVLYFKPYYLSYGKYGPGQKQQKLFSKGGP